MVDLTDYEGGHDASGSIVAGAILAFQDDNEANGFQQFDRWLDENDIGLPVASEDYNQICDWLDNDEIDPEQARMEFQRHLERQRDDTG